ncbi:MAG: carboxypeptidase regulatory-like domain-containing protein [Gemmatimonadales bacterium]
MTHPSRWHVARLARFAAVFGAALLFGAAQLAAQGTTGKIEGTVRDQAGAAVAGAQVLIVGSAFSSTSNEQGYYFINNVPAGVMTVRAQYIGYAPSEVRNVRVFAGQTMTVNLQLEQRAIEVTGINVTVGATPIVPRDQVASKSIVAGDLVQSLPVGQASDALRLQPGVVESARGLSLRGSRTDEAIVYLDGVPMRSVSGRTGTGRGAPNAGLGVNVIGTDALEEVSVTTGAIGASQGDAQSGVISFVTRSGGERLTGYLSGATDELSGQTYGQGLNRFEGSLGGPLAHNLKFFVSTVMEGRQNPLLGKGSSDAPLYVLNGIDTTVTVALKPGTATSDSQVVSLPAFTRYSSGQRRPDNWSNDWNLDGKLTYSYGSGSRFSAAFHRTRSQGLTFRGSAPTGNIYDPQSQTGFMNLSNALILNWTQDLTRSAGRAFALDASFSFQGDRSTAGLVDQSWFASNHNPTGNFSFGDIPFVVNTSNFALDDRLIQNIRVNNCQNGRDAARPTMGGCIPFLNRASDFSTAAAYRTNPYGVDRTFYSISGTGSPGTALAQENRVTGRVSADWQADRYNRVQFGGDFVRADVRTFNSNSLTSQIFMDAAAYKPNRFGVYAQDRLDLGDVVIDFGLRYDRLQSNVLFPTIPGRINSDPLTGHSGTPAAGLTKVLAEVRTPANICGGPNGVFSGCISASDTAAIIANATATANRCAADIAASDTTSWATCNLSAGSPHSVLLPSVRVSFPITDRTGFRLSYAQQAQTPEFQRYAASVNTDLAITNTNSVWGQDINYGKTILFEFGVRHAFSQDMVLDVSLYNKDIVSDVTGRVEQYFDYSTGSVQGIDLYTNQDFGNVRGIDFKLDRRIGSLFQGSLSYTLQASKSTGSDPTEYLNTYSRSISAISGDREPPPQAILTTGDNRTHTIAGNLVLNLPHGWQEGSMLGTLFQDFGAFATFRFASGLPYTPFSQGANGCINLGGGGLGPNNGFGLQGVPCAPLNSATTPWIKNVDLRLTRGFQISNGRNITVFADFRNLFNFTNILNLFVETGDIHNATFQDKSTVTVIDGLHSEAGGLYTTKTIGGVAKTGIDLSNCAAFNPLSSAGVPDCIMLRRTEARFADPDDPNGANLFYTDTEINRALGAWYLRGNGPQTLVGPGLNFRFGFELNF